MSKAHPESVIDALYSGDYATVERYVTAENVNIVDANGDSLLSLAATAIDLNTKIVRLLVKRGADVNIRLREGWTLLHHAAHLLRKDLALILLREGCDPNAVDDVGQTALAKVLFAFNPKASLIAILLEHGADARATMQSGESALELASRTGQADLFPTKRKR